MISHPQASISRDTSEHRQISETDATDRQVCTRLPFAEGISDSVMVDHFHEYLKYLHHAFVIEFFKATVSFCFSRIFLDFLRLSQFDTPLPALIAVVKLSQNILITTPRAIGNGSAKIASKLE